MSSDGPPKFGEEEANALLAAGWRQGAVFKPFGDLRPKNDEYFFVVCTQSCSVVSPNLIRDPFVEIAEGKPLQHYKKNSPEAIGKNVTKFQMPVTNDQFAALEVDINTRRFVARDLFLNRDPEDFKVSDPARRELAGWLARYYSRVALPNGLVRRLRKNAIPKLKKIFDKKYGENNISGYEFITSISMKNEPNCEIKDGEYYKFELFILCKDQNSANIFDLELINIFENEISTFDGIKFEIRVQSEDQTLMSDFRGYVRFSEWDYLSPMWETATNPVA